MTASANRPSDSAPVGSAGTRCFHEHDLDVPLQRRAFVEAIGACLLVFVAAASCTNQLPHTPALPLVSIVTGAIATAGALVSLILALGPVSGGHFNPLITTLQWLRRERSSRVTLTYCVAQLMGAVFGAILANMLCARNAASGAGIATHIAPLARLAASEMLASAALMTIVFACARARLRSAGPVSVGAWLVAAIIATPSGSLANPAIVIAEWVARGPMALTGLTTVVYVLAECAGALIALGLIAIAYPERARANSPA